MKRKLHFQSEILQEFNQSKINITFSKDQLLCHHCESDSEIERMREEGDKLHQENELHKRTIASLKAHISQFESQMVQSQETMKQQYQQRLSEYLSEVQLLQQKEIFIKEKKELLEGQLEELQLKYDKCNNEHQSLKKKYQTLLNRVNF